MNTATTLGRAEFSCANDTHQKLFRVNAGVPIEDALEAISLFQYYANQLTLDAAMSDKGERFSWPAFYLGEVSKALIDDVNDALYAASTAP
ncbi:DUF3077 domain-containing protein [Pseudomonas fluorescens group sp.]|uniref:DUF3077 domain-containing protein n=2 Tax=Pseudomonas fluorescens TaxID=294 RepID=C3KBS5_PSEFS|nr:MULTISPECIES: DUF3077 domain-containing protein [Pseudomonas fluorescens group]MBZ6455734.1 DUF3077 domain-containing protein [Pseudomonas fluorescens group sp.]MBZ6462480.1 DUF3077 domain-containing protein [Pseudomonas fluorescens group sp.]MBZ6468297.1 DUF3077 domain-containing protein [Pseudomonas fluorescens group sp.]WQD72548.1 DUF3077 domain-containing protein [Pseudomonas marginalis]CAI2794514.1 Uncharacterized protein PFLU_0175 [Pseudomonas fluorescens SBW25]